MTALRALLSSLLAVAILATGIGVGVARGAMAADGQLCSVTGPAPIAIAHDGLPLFDADGDPVTLDRDLCLDCLTVAFALPQQAALAAPLARVAAPLLPSVSPWSPAHEAPGGQARAPPPAA
ncbi:hypothetical protein HKCCSP123_18025 [Rhodobacterales bacterium HKCCSP123]|nr:hypothetical protein [Rhodobacterales bacterium HKCCSP123]